MKIFKSYRNEIFILVLIVILGVTLRVFGLDKYPAGFHNDEAWTGLIARQILEKGYIGFWSDSALGQPSLFFYWSALLFKIFGDSAATVRLSFALLHVFSLPFLYLLIRFLFSYQAALFATFFFATGPVPLEFARRGDLPAVSFSFFPSLFFYLKALQTNKWKYFFLCGLFLGLNNYAYHSYALIAPILAVYTLFFVLTKKLSFKKIFLSFIILIGTYLLVFSPLLKISLRSPEIVFGKFRSFSIFPLSLEGLRHIQSYAPHVRNSLDAIIYNLKVSLPIFYTGHDDSMDSHVFGPIQAFFFSLGLITAIKYARKDFRLFSYFIFITLFISSIFTLNAPTFRRFQANIYFAYVFTGVGAWISLIWCMKLLKRYRKIAAILIISISIISGLHNSYLYFSKYAVSPQTKAYTGYSYVVVAHYMNNLPKNTQIYFYSSLGPLNHETLRYLLSPEIQAQDRSKEWTHNFSFNRDTLNQPVTYILFSNYLDKIYDIEALYPDGKKTEHKDTDGTLQFISYSLPAEE